MSEVIVLAGGFGSRLRSVVADRPKPLSEIAGRAFLEWQLDALIERGVSRIVLSVGYMADSIQTHFSDKYRGLEVVYCKEDEPLGTGGAIRLSLNSCKSEYPFVVNGDSFSWYPLDDLRANMTSDVDAVMALLWVEQADRYAVVSFDEKSKQVVGFFSKRSNRIYQFGRILHQSTAIFSNNGNRTIFGGIRLLRGRSKYQKFQSCINK
jgi:D-glycero-alpha-D-manno-heptose 1-phosphate guanylyltransferase